MMMMLSQRGRFLKCEHGLKIVTSCPASFFAELEKFKTQHQYKQNVSVIDLVCKQWQDLSSVTNEEKDHQRSLYVYVDNDGQW